MSPPEAVWPPLWVSPPPLGLSVPQVTKIFLKLRQMGLDLPQDVYTVPWAVKTILEAKARKEAKGEGTTC